MKRIITAILAIVLLGGALVALSGAAIPIPGPSAVPAPEPGCQNRESTPASPGPWHYVFDEDWWQAGSYRVSAGCGGYIQVDSDGWRFDGTQCGQMWVRRQRADGTTYILPGSVKHVCPHYGWVVLASRQPINARIWIEAWPYALADRNPTIWPLGRIQF